MSLGLHPDESKFAAYLQAKGLGDVSSRVLSVAVCRRSLFIKRRIHCGFGILHHR